MMIIQDIENDYVARHVDGEANGEESLHDILVTHRYHLDLIHLLVVEYTQTMQGDAQREVVL